MSRLARSRTARARQVGSGQRRIGDDTDLAFVDGELALDLVSHRIPDRHEVFEERTLGSEPVPVRRPDDDRRKIAAFQIVADLDECRRAPRPKKQLHRDTDDGVGVAGAEDGVDLLGEQEPEKAPDHPGRLPAIGRERLFENAIFQVRSDPKARPAASAEDDHGLMPGRSPTFRQPKRDTLDAAWLEAMNGNGDSHAG